MSNGFNALSVHDEQPDVGVLSVIIYINGKALNTPYMLTAVWVRKAVNQIGKAELSFTAWDTIRTGEDTESDKMEFTPGNTIRIEAGYLNTLAEESIFEGMITAQQIDIEEDGRAMLKIECRDYFYPATMVPKSNIFTDMDDHKILNTIAGNYSPLQATIGTTATTYGEIAQYHTTDWDFLLQRARMSGFCIITEGCKTVIDQPAVTASSVFKFIYGRNIIGIKGKLQASGQLSKVQVLAWDSKGQQLKSVVINNVTDNDQGDLTPEDLAQKMGNKEWVLQTSEYTDDDSLRKWASAKLLETSLKRVQGEVTCIGTALIKAGSIVEIDGVSRHMDGKAYCGYVEHDLKDGKWLTTAGMGFSEEQSDGINGGKETDSNKVNNINGLQIGKVVRIEDDPAKEYNIQVEIPLFKSDQVNKVWARLVTFWASKQYGSFFIPDVGDEVVIGFLDSDPGKPAILGSVYSSNQAPAYPFDKNNNLRSILTRSKLRLEFEEEKKSITIATPGNNSVTISDEGKSITLADQNGNTIVMTDSGISVQSAKSISFKAQTGISIEAGTDISIKGNTAVNIQAANIEAKADVAFTGKGSASAELSAGGQTVVKGAMVMIN